MFDRYKPTKDMLTRWLSLEKGDGLRRAGFMARVLWIVGLLLCILVALGVAFKVHPVAVAVPAAVMGWIIAESNALRSRLAHWPIFKRYLDWKRVEEDLGRN